MADNSSPTVPSTVLLLVAVLMLSGTYLAVEAAPTLTYVAAVLGHAATGLVVVGVWVVWTRRLFSRRLEAPVALWAVSTVAGLSGLALLIFGNPFWNYVVAQAGR